MNLTKAELLCLRRTRLLQQTEIDPRDIADFVDGPSTQDKTWNRLKIKGYVANGRGYEIRLTKKGEKALANR